MRKFRQRQLILGCLTQTELVEGGTQLPPARL
jgi:hypothetical protein